MPSLDLPYEESHAIDVTVSVAALERLVMHAELIALLHVENDKVAQEPQHEEEKKAGAERSADGLVGALAFHAQLHWFSKGVKRTNWL